MVVAAAYAGQPGGCVVCEEEVVWVYHQTIRRVCLDHDLSFLTVSGSWYEPSAETVED
jgi:hypothetical protein